MHCGFIVMVGLTVALLSTLVLAGCGGGGSSGSKSAAGDSGGSAASSTLASAGAGPAARGSVENAVQTRSVISTGTVDLVSKDVARVRAEVVDLVDAYDGFLADERTSTNDHGQTSYAMLVLRVPANQFGTVLDRLGKLGKLQDSTRKSNDVTTQVIDIDQRVRAQQVGLRRLEVLLGRAASLSDLLKVENQVTARQGELDSLRAQQKYLRSQTSLATITVRIDHAAKPRPREQTSGFLAGLHRGWHGLVALVRSVLTLTGTALPFAVPAVVLGGPIWLLVRRLRRSARTQSAT
jgi:hypothetical protein